MVGWVRHAHEFVHASMVSNGRRGIPPIRVAMYTAVRVYYRCKQNIAFVLMMIKAISCRYF